MDKTRGEKSVHAADDPSAAGGASSPQCRDPGYPKEVNQELPNPLAIGVTIGGLLLDIVAPRPKPR